MITYWFPIGIYHSFYPYHDSLKKELLKLYPKKDYSSSDETQGWPFWTKSIQKGFQNPLLKDSPILCDFSNWVELEVDDFSRSYGSIKNYQIQQCWMNYYEKGDFQEPHIHPGFDFSAIYYVSVPEKSGRLVFENPNAIFEMRPIRVDKDTDLNCTAAIYQPLEGQLVVFRSNLRHGVYPHNNTEPRISLAFNLNEK